MSPDLTPARQLANAAELWHARARKLDAGIDPVLSDLSVHARIWICKDGGARPGKVLAKLALTAQHADYLASCIVGPSAFASSTPSALGQWLASNHPAPPEAAVCWLVARDPHGQVKGSVPLDEAGVAGFTEQLRTHAAWLTREDLLRGLLPIREGDRVEVVGSAAHLRAVRGEVGTLVRIKLVQPDPEPHWYFEVRLDHARPSWPTGFGDGDIARCEATPLGHDLTPRKASL